MEPSDQSPPPPHDRPTGSEKPEPILAERMQEDVDANKDIAAFSYLYVTSVLVYLLKGRQSAFIRFHSKQAMLLFVLAVIVWFVPFIGRLLELIVLAGVVTGFLFAAQGKWQDVPFIGPFSRGELHLRQSWKQLVDAAATLARMIRSKSSSPPSSAPPPHHPPEDKTSDPFA